MSPGPKPAWSNIRGFIEARIKRVPETGCHVWIKACDKKTGYARTRLGVKNRYVRELTWELANGPVPEDKEVRHKCGVPACVNPEHLVLVPSRKSPEEMKAHRLRLFTAKYMPVPESGCWIWTGALSRHRYATFYDGVSTIRAHIWAYETFVGPIKQGLVLDHKCRVRCCVNPNHLEPVTTQENTALGLRGALNPMKKNKNEWIQRAAREIVSMTVYGGLPVPMVIGDKERIELIEAIIKRYSS